MNQLVLYFLQAFLEAFDAFVGQFFDRMTRKGTFWAHTGRCTQALVKSTGPC
jgi:hypothetical protein